MATPPAPTSHTSIYTYFTKANGKSELLYSAETWVRVELQLETAGPVSVGTRQEVIPVLSGKGILLPASGESIKFTLPRGDRIFIAAESINRVKFIVEPIPWQEQILLSVRDAVSSINVLTKLTNMIGRKKRPPTPTEDPPCPPPIIPPHLGG